MNDKRAFADLHCHYPMHLLPSEYDPPGYKKNFLERVRDLIQPRIIALAAYLFNDRNRRAGWRVEMPYVEESGVRLVCSMLYWPAAEFDLSKKYASPPIEQYWKYVEYQLEKVEKDLNERIAGGAPVVIAKRAADLIAPGRIAFVHCVEGGFHLGDSASEMDARVGRLADQGVFYITVAHLFYRQVATNAPAIPMFSDAVYKRIFCQPTKGLTDLGEALICAMYKHKVIIDITHMSERAIQETFGLVESLEKKDPGSDPGDYPLIAGHVGMRSAGPGHQEYNLSEETAKRIQARGGLIGLIMAQHQLGNTKNERESKDVLQRHLDAIQALGNGHGATAIGTDIDGFIRPTLEGVEYYSDMQKVADWVVQLAPADADAILYGNAQRVIKRTFEVRAAAGGAGTAPPPHP